MSTENTPPSTPRKSGPAGPLPRVRLSDPGALVNAVPLMLGVHLSDDLVLVATQGRLNVLTARMDLSLLPDALVWPSVQHALASAGAEQVHLVAFAPGPVTDQALHQLHRQLLHLVADAPVRLQIGWVLTSSQGRWWQHDLTSTAPHGPGIPVREDPTSLALRLTRGVPASSLDDIADATAPHAPDILDHIRQALAALPPERRRTVRQLSADTALQRRRERPAPWGIVEAASVLDALKDVQVRDELATHSDQEHAVWTWSTLLPYAPPAWVAPVATLAALAAYQNGHSILARSALTRALNADPNYTLARLLARAMEAGMSPLELRERILIPAQAALRDASQTGSL